MCAALANYDESCLSVYAEVYPKRSVAVAAVSFNVGRDINGSSVIGQLPFSHKPIVFIRGAGFMKGDLVSRLVLEFKPGFGGAIFIFEVFWP